MLAFLPALAPIVLGADLAMPNIATWWLGRADMREEMLEKLDSMVDRLGVRAADRRAQPPAKCWEPSSTTRSAGRSCDRSATAASIT